MPAVYLEKRTDPGHRVRWAEISGPTPDGHGNIHVLNRSRLSYGLVLSHDCELDKDKRRGRVHIAMLKEVASLNPTEQEKVLAGISILTRGLDSHQHPAARKRKVHAWVFVQVLCTVPQRANSASR